MIRNLIGSEWRSAADGAGSLPVFNPATAANGYNFVIWAQDGVTYWAVSDVPASDLLEFTRLFSTQD